MAVRLGILACFALLAVATPAGATFRGHNGLIAFTTSREVNSSIDAASPDGGAQFPLIPNASDPEWSPDGKRLAFDNEYGSRPSGTDSDIYVADADGSNVRQIARLGTYEYSPSWSPDGKRLVFVLDAGLESKRSGIYVVSSGGTGLHLVRKAFGAQLDSPVWSPNGRWIAFLGETGYARHAELDLFVIHPNGKGLRRLTHTGNDERKPCWSPDSTRLVFDRHHNGSEDIFLLTLRTGRQRVLIGGDNDDSEPVWSPDGTMIAFVRVDYAASELGAIYIARPNGGIIRRSTALSTYATRLAWQPLP